MRESVYFNKRNFSLGGDNHEKYTFGSACRAAPARCRTRLHVRSPWAAAPRRENASRFLGLVGSFLPMEPLPDTRDLRCYESELLGPGLQRLGVDGQACCRPTAPCLTRQRSERVPHYFLRAVSKDCRASSLSAEHVEHSN